MFDDTRGGGGDDGDGFGYSFFGRPMHYVLVDRIPVACANFITWAIWYEQANRRVALHRVRGLKVSTIFLGLDCAINGPPLLFESAVFRGDELLDVSRAPTWDAAEKLHRLYLNDARIVRSARALARQSQEARDDMRALFCRPPSPD